MSCAKKIVECWIITKNGDIFHGRNDCDTPQTACPRAPGENYDKCKSICHQPGHAEEMAILAAWQHDLNGATAYMDGTTHYCKNCQQLLFDCGVKYLTRGKPNILQHYIFHTQQD